MEQVKKLIEVAMPIKELSAECVRDKSIRHGHISTLHLWWARRPLPVCRAVVFASLVPDPLDKNCPESFKDAVEILLGKANNAGDPYKPYDKIPYTAADDKMEDNLRNRLLMFIGKFSERYILNERQGKKTDAKDLLSNASLIKWDNKNNEEILNKARKLIWVAYNSNRGLTTKSSLSEFEKYYTAIKTVEKDLYSSMDRHNSNESIEIKGKLQDVIDQFLDKMPKVFDPFAGGGAIPLEAARLGCRSFGNDINPVAHIIQKAGLEFPQKFGKPITYSKTEFINLYGSEFWNQQPQQNKDVKNGEAIAVHIENRLAFDVEYYANKLLKLVEKDVGHYYPTDEKGNKPIAYYWARVVTCSNPTCRAEVPLLRQFYLANTKSRKIYLNPIVKGNLINFEIKNGDYQGEGWQNRGNLKCPCCGSITDVKKVKEQFLEGESKEKILAVIWESKDGKEYKLPTKTEMNIISTIPKSINRPQEMMPTKFTQTFACCTWGVIKWGDMFSNRQLISLQSFVDNFTKLKSNITNHESEYAEAILSYLGLFIDRIAVANTSFGVWHTTGEKLERPLGRQATGMVFDFPESNLFCNSTGSAANQLEWIIRYIESESNHPFISILKNASSGEKEQFPNKYITSVITDPPYYDAIAYSDLSDFFYVWLKRTLSDIYPLNFATPLTPKSDECTALKHHHDGNFELAKKHFEDKLLQIFDTIERQTSDLVSIMFAHQSTEAWTTLCNSILGARMNITGSWANDTEMAGALKTDKAFLSSSVTVACKPSIKQGIGSYKEVRKAVELTVTKEVSSLYSLGFRGADLLTACFGKAVSEFGKYERVEKADGSEVTVAELLEMARESAFNALLKGFDGDEFTKFYIGWLQLYGFTESDFDDAAKFSRVGLTINVSDLFTHNIFLKKGNKQELAGYRDRLLANHKIGDIGHGFIIDNVHKAMSLYSGTNRNALLEYITKVAISPESSFWRVITSLCEILPQGSDDHKQAAGLLLNKDSLIRESKNIQQSPGAQGQLF
jgi:adenine-specific DNA methylase